MSGGIAVKKHRKIQNDPLIKTAVLLLILFLLLFIVYPIFSLLLESFAGDGGGVSFAGYMEIWSKRSFRGVFLNTLILGLCSGILATSVGFLFAYVDCYVKTRFGGLFKIISVLPVVSPPFVLSLSAIMLFGRSGFITNKLFGMVDANIYGLHGILIVETLTFFPICYLMLKGLLKNIDPALEEAARNLGASRWETFTTVTLPLLAPGLANAFLITFIEAVADFSNPMMIGGNYSTLATSIYIQAVGAYDLKGATVMAVILLLLSMSLFVLSKYWVESKSVATLTGKASRERMPIGDKSVTVPLSAICLFFTVCVLVFYALVPLGALFKLWGRDYSFSLAHFKYVLTVGIKPFKDSLIFSAIAAPITAIISMIIAYLVVKRRFIGKSFIEFTSLFAMAVPGTVLGLGYIRAFNTGLLGSGFMTLTGTAAIIILAYVVRSLPVGTRSGMSALRQIDKSLEESAYDMGAGSGKVFTSVTLPLIKDSFFSGLVTAFVRSMTATSAVIFLVSPSHQLITPQIMAQADIGRFGVACAYSTLLILIVYSAILLMNLFLKFFGVSRTVVTEGN
ncbi:iron ABC transporter permease [Oscillospiraceae bacterium MB08-C2-2]|nr:iron ABC transporter permease [Oscillospiraceae bacterium MB08-C2-2]